MVSLIRNLPHRGIKPKIAHHRFTPILMTISTNQQTTTHALQAANNRITATTECRNERGPILTTTTTKQTTALTIITAFRQAHSDRECTARTAAACATMALLTTMADTIGAVRLSFILDRSAVRRQQGTIHSLSGIRW